MSLSNQNHYSYINNNTVPIVFIHGVGLDQKMWAPQINYFRDYSTITYDLLGHGKTPFKKDKLSQGSFLFLPFLAEEALKNSQDKKFMKNLCKKTHQKHSGKFYF